MYAWKSKDQYELENQDLKRGECFQQLSSLYNVYETNLMHA